MLIGDHLTFCSSQHFRLRLQSQYQGSTSCKPGLASKLLHCIYTHLVLIYLPSLVRSLSDVAFSEPARSIKLYKSTEHQHRVLCCRARGGMNAQEQMSVHSCLPSPAVSTLQVWAVLEQASTSHSVHHPHLYQSLSPYSQSRHGTHYDSGYSSRSSLCLPYGGCPRLCAGPHGRT